MGRKLGKGGNSGSSGGGSSCRDPGPELGTDEGKSWAPLRYTEKKRKLREIKGIFGFDQF